MPETTQTAGVDEDQADAPASVDPAPAETQPENHAALYAALAAAQAEYPVVEKGRSTKAGGKMNFSYATMADYAVAIYPILTKHGLSFTCLPSWFADKGFHLRARLTHASGEFLEGMVPLRGSTAQEIGSSITYGRRQLFAAMTGAVADDETDEKKQAETAERAKNPNARTSTKKRAASQADPVEEGYQPDPWENQIRQGEPPVTQAQLTKMIMLFDWAGIKERDERLEYASQISDRLLASSKQMTMPEASKVIERLIDQFGDLPPKELTAAQKAEMAARDQARGND